MAYRINLNRLFSFFVFLFIDCLPCLAYQAEVENVPSEKYFDVALREIDKAQSCIRLTMFYISLDIYQKDSKVYRLADALLRAKTRGVDIQIVLDENIDFVAGVPNKNWTTAAKNYRAYRFFHDKGLDVWFDDASNYTHSKVLIVDNQTVLVGSAN